jgi:hypothetical protein
MDLLRIKKDPFRHRRLSRIDVGHKPNISGSGEPFFPSHLSFSAFVQGYIVAILEGFLRKVNPPNGSTFSTEGLPKNKNPSPSAL